MTDHAALLKAGLLRKERLLRRLAVFFVLAAVFTVQVLDGLSAEDPVTTHLQQEQNNE